MISAIPSNWRFFIKTDGLLDETITNYIVIITRIKYQNMCIDNYRPQMR